MFNWLKSCQSVYIYGSDSLTSLPMYIAVLIALNSCCHCYCCFVFIILLHMKQCLLVALICSSVMMADGEYLFTSHCHLTLLLGSIWLSLLPILLSCERSLNVWVQASVFKQICFPFLTAKLRSMGGCCQEAYFCMRKITLTEFSSNKMH